MKGSSSGNMVKVLCSFTSPSPSAFMVEDESGADLSGASDSLSARVVTGVGVLIGRCRRGAAAAYFVGLTRPAPLRLRFAAGLPFDSDCVSIAGNGGGDLNCRWANVG
jgi:hypothetical protein